MKILILITFTVLVFGGYITAINAAYASGRSGIGTFLIAIFIMSLVVFLSYVLEEK